MGVQDMNGNFEFNGIIQSYLDAVKTRSEMQIRYSPSVKEWSLLQLYSHLIVSSKDFYFPAIERCLRKKSAMKSGCKTLPGFVILKSGWMPPFKFKVVRHQRYTAETNWSREQLERELTLLMKKVKLFTETIAFADMKYKVKHPTLGWLNAKEWLQTDMLHYKHHLKQLEKIQKWLQ